MKRFLFTSACMAFAFLAYTQTKPISTKTTKPPSTSSAVAKETLIEIKTNYGTMIAKLYNSTPLHRDNFIKLVKQGFYDSLLFHRVINGFMIQGGDPVSKNAGPEVMLGAGSDPGIDRIPAEFRSNLFHKKGALAAARDGNPEKASSNCQFYIVQGVKDTSTARMRATTLPNQKETYARMGGTPFLDQEYTVFGEVFIGMDVIDKIASVQTGSNDRPEKNVIMTIKILN